MKQSRTDVLNFQFNGMYEILIIASIHTSIILENSTLSIQEKIEYKESSNNQQK